MALLEETNMLISRYLMDHLASFVEPPAQLCLIRVLGSDHEFVFRVRYEDVHLDYPFVVPLLDNADKVAEQCNWDSIAKALVVMSAMVVPPAERAKLSATSRRTPQILAPMPRYLSPYE